MRNDPYPDKEGNFAPRGTGYVGHLEISINMAKLSWLGFDDGQDEKINSHREYHSKSAVLDS